MSTKITVSIKDGLQKLSNSFIWASMRKNLSLVFTTQSDCSTTKSNYNIDLLLVASLDMILSSEGIIKALIRLHRCAGWFVPLLFANPKDSFLAPRPLSRLGMSVTTQGGSGRQFVTGPGRNIIKYRFVLLNVYRFWET